MASLTVGGVNIKVAVSSPRWTRSDAVDRARAFDNTFRASQTGGAVRVWDFETPPVLASTEGETYKAALSTVASQLCSGDIIALPTMCSAELTDGVPTSVAGEPYVVLSFTLYEVQPAKVLLRYASGDTISGESFSRSTTAYYRGIGGGLLDVKAINVKRDAHYVGGLAPRTILLEGASTNSVLWANDFSNAIWVKTNMTVGTGISAPDGTTTACTLTATAGSARVTQSLAAGSSLARTMSLWIKRRTGTGTIQIAKPDNSTYTTVAVTASWERYTAVGAASTTRYAELNIVTSGDAIDVWCGQIDDRPFATSEIPTTTVAVTRGADSYSIPFTTPPQEMTVYAKFVEVGNVLTVAGTVFQISNAASANARFESYGVTYYNAYHHNDGTGSVSTLLPVPPALGNTVELALCLYGDGSVDITQSLNAGAASTSTRSAAHDFAAVWSGPLLWLNSAGSGIEVGFTALQLFKVVAGTRSLTEMRSL